ncbi:UNKNOWN [Stylonychia lemnae]|uniref:Uncharacterized protein n=1 Tax=Stylonychia lemnae TaxID=5949 RepID=A0A078B9F7_STYLE|nr:UNKNOWN [Stylonychia lemnae]|eukprot:CDW91039.1 UNKNOWN [Stylonychia lemnae]
MQRNKILSENAEIRRKYFIDNSAQHVNEILNQGKNEELIGSYLHKYQFRERIRDKEICDQDFRMTQYENMKSRVDRIQQQTQRALLFEKYKQKEKNFILRPDDRTQNKRGGLRSTQFSKTSRAQKQQSLGFRRTSISQMNNTNYSQNNMSKNAIKVDDGQGKPDPYFKFNFAEDLSMRNSPRLLKLKSKSPDSAKNSNSRLSVNKSLLSTTIVPSNRQYENFERFNKLSMTLGADSFNNFHNPGQSTNQFTQFATDLIKTTKNNALQRESNSIMVLKDQTQSTSKYSPSRDQIILEYTQEDLSQQLKSIKKPVELERLLSERHSLINTNVHQSIEHKAKLKNVIKNEWEKHVLNTSTGFFDKNKIYMQTMNEVQNRKQNLRARSFNMHNSLNNTQRQRKRLFNLTKQTLLLRQSQHFRFSTFHSHQQMNFDSYLVNQMLEQKLDVLSLNDNENETKQMIFNENEITDLDEVLDLKGRNSKQPKKSNHGARPCSSVMRKLKRCRHYKGGITVG